MHKKKKNGLWILSKPCPKLTKVCTILYFGLVQLYNSVKVTSRHFGGIEVGMFHGNLATRSFLPANAPIIAVVEYVNQTCIDACVKGVWLKEKEKSTMVNGSYMENDWERERELRSRYAF